MRQSSNTINNPPLGKILPHILTSLVGGVFVFLAVLQPIPLVLTWERVVVLITCLVIFICADLLAGKVESGLWAGYLNLVVMVMWFSTALFGTLTLILMGSLWAMLIRLQGNILPGATPLPRPIIIRLVFKRISLCGISLLGAWAVFTTLGGVTPLEDTNFNFFATFFGLLTGLIITQIMGVLLSEVDPKPPVLWAKNQRGRLFNEILLLATVAPLTLVYQSQGVVIFVLLMGLVAAQAIRHWQIHRTQTSLIQRVQELSILNDTAQSISSSLELTEMLHSFYNALQKFSDIPIFYIALYQEEYGIFNFPLVMEYGKKQLWGTVNEKNHTTFAHIIQNKVPLLITAPENIHTLGHPQLNLNYHAFLGLPLMVGDKLLGIMGIADERSIRLLEKIGAPTLNTIARQLGLAIRNSTLYARTTKLAHDLGQINQLTQSVSLAPEQQEAMDEACMTTLRITKADKVAFFMLNDDKKTMSLTSHRGLTPPLLELYKKPDYQQETILVNAPLLIHDITTLDINSLEAKLAQVGGYRAIAKIPLKSSNVVTGIMLVYHQQVHYYHQTEIDLLQTLANQLAVAYDNAELLRALELYGWEQSQLVYLSDISTSTLDVETIIINVTRILQYSTESDWADLVLAPQYQKEVEFNNVTSLIPAQDVSGIPELAALHARKGTATSVFRFEISKLSQSLTNFMQDNLLRTLIATPLITNNRVIGLLLLGNFQDKILSDSKQRLFEMAANQIATQIHNALLYQRTQQALNRRMKQLNLIETIAQQISGALNREQLIRNVLQAAINASGADLAALALITPQHTLRIIQMEASDDDWKDEDITTELNVGLVGKVIETKSPLIIANNLRERAYVQPYTEDADSKPPMLSSVLVPLFQDSKVIGVLNVESLNLDFFNDEHIEFFKSLAGHAVISIQNANLLEERQERIEQISANNNQLQAILDSTRDGVILLNRDGMLIRANHSAEEMLKVQFSQQGESHFTETLWDEYALASDADNRSLADTLTEMLRILRSEPDMLTTTPFELHKDGQARYIRMVGSPVKDSQNHIIGRLLTLHDISEERLLAKYRQNITRMMVHDLRGPLSSVISGVSFATSLISEDADPTLNEVMNISLNNAQDLLELVESLLDIYKLQAGQMLLNLVEIDFSQIVNSAYSALTASMQEANIQFKRVISPDLPRIYVDANIVRRVLINLLDNAVRYSPTGGEVWLIAKQVNNMLEIQIADSGQGIPLAEQDRIFDEFHQVQNNVPKRGSKGSGLGLTFCKLAIEAHHGTIHISPQSPLSGACFVLTLPVLRQEMETQTTAVTAVANV
jgi:signal transduction histidine kinase